MKRSRLVLIPGALLIIALGAVGALFLLNATKQSSPPDISGAEPSTGRPSLQVAKVVGGLDHPWDVAFLPSKTMLISERGGAISKVTAGKKTVLTSPSDVNVAGEGGMLGIAVDPEFATNRFIYTCFNSTLSGQPDVRVVRFTVNSAETRFDARNDIVTGIPANTSGRHSGCRIGFGADKNLWIGTGDAADESQPQNQNTLGGKILRIDRDGNGVAGNSTVGDDRVYSYGHRNTQGLALYTTVMNGSYGMSVEHGPDRDDEINQLVPGNFGWAPGTGYDESADMTDTARFPVAIKSVWSSGNPTIAVSGADFLTGEKWDDWQGALAVAVLKDEHIRIFIIASDSVENEEQILQAEYGRIRTVRMGPDQNLYFTTDNGNDDGVYMVTPS